MLISVFPISIIFIISFFRQAGNAFIPGLQPGY